MLLLLFASDSPSRLKKAGTGYWSVKEGWEEESFREKKYPKSERKF